MPSLERISPVRTVLAGSIKGGFTRHGFNAGNAGQGERLPLFTHLFSPVEQEIELGVFWGPTYLNGKALQPSNCPLRGNRQNARAHLRAGWNFVYALPETLRACWTWLMELPDRPGLLLRALADADCAYAFGLGAPLRLPPGEPFPPAPASLDELPGAPGAWKYTPLGVDSCSPARELAWDLPADVWQENSPYQPGQVLPPGHEAVTLVLDYGQEYIGHLSVEFETENGTILDLGYDERLTEDKILAHYRCNPFVNAADRSRFAPGRQQFDTFHERGGRYVQLTFRGRPGRVRIHRVEVLSKIAECEVVGDFRCDDALYDWIWRTGTRTVLACTNDGWTDCPWRERSMYVGDVLVAAAATRKLVGDWRMEQWAIRLWARAQLPDGQLLNMVPSEHKPLCDYTLLWIILLRNNWAVTGDAALVREMWSAVRRIFDSPLWKTGAGGLWEVHPEGAIFVDWGVVPEERQGVNGVLNAFRVRALECAAELAAAIGQFAEAKEYASQARTVRAALRDVLWDQQRGRFAACRIDGSLSEGPALHVNALALAYGLADGGAQDQVLSYLKNEIGTNAHCQPGHLELYFLIFLLEGLYRVEETALAEEVIRDHYRLLQEHGAWTFWETLMHGLGGKNSLCHAWSACPLIFFSERLLGVREEVPGDPSRMLLAPEIGVARRGAGRGATP